MIQITWFSMSVNSKLSDKYSESFYNSQIKRSEYIAKLGNIHHSKIVLIEALNGFI